MAITQINGLPIIDAKHSVNLIITANDVAKADLKDPADCVVARACRRELNAKEVRVHLGRVYVRTTPDKWTRYITPRSMRTEIIAFDRGGAFSKGEYHLSTPSIKSTGKQQGSKTKQLGKKNQKKRRSPHIVTDVRLGPAG